METAADHEQSGENVVLVRVRGEHHCDCVWMRDDFGSPPKMESIVDYEAWVTKGKVVLERYKAMHPGKHLDFALSADRGLTFMRAVENPNPHLFWENPLTIASTSTKVYSPGEDDQFWGEINRQFVLSRMERRRS